MCARLGWLGIVLDGELNTGEGDRLLTGEGLPVAVIEAREDLEMAGQADALLSS